MVRVRSGGRRRERERERGDEAIGELGRDTRGALTYHDHIVRQVTFRGWEVFLERVHGGRIGATVTVFVFAKSWNNLVWY